MLGYPHYFIVVDHCAEQGTTIANLVSYIEHNGGQVLLAVGSDAPLKPIAIESHAHKYGAIDSESEEGIVIRPDNTTTPPYLREALYSSMKEEGFKIGTKDPIDHLEEALRDCWVNSVQAMTHGECKNLMQTINPLRKWSGHGYGSMSRLLRMPA